MQAADDLVEVVALERLVEEVADAKPRGVGAPEVDPEGGKHP